MRRRSRFRASTLFLAVVLSAAPAFARGHEAKSSTTEVHSLLDSVWHALGGLFPGLLKGYGTIDPDGAASTPPAGGETDGRWTIDPDG